MLPNTCVTRSLLPTILLLAAALAAVAVINPNGVKAGTHLDELVVVKLGPATAGKPLQAEVVRLLKGELPPPPKIDKATGKPVDAKPPTLPKKITLAVARDAALATRLNEAMKGQETALLFVGDFWGNNVWDPRDPKPGLCGALRIGTSWFALQRFDEYEQEVTVTADAIVPAAVWPGLDAALDSGAKYASDRMLRDFGFHWPGEAKIGALGAACTGALAVDLARDGKPALMLLSTAGDKLFRFAADGTATDITAETKLATKSRAATWADMNADGALDLASWDGKTLAVYLGGADGLAAAPVTLAVPACLGLTPMSGPAGARLVMSTPAGPSVVKLAAGALAVNAPTSKPGQTLTAPCVVADVNNDGIDDMVQPVGGAAPSLLCWLGQPTHWFGKFVESPLGNFLVNPNGTSVGDFDNDGLLDILISGERGALIARNSGGGKFRTSLWGIGGALGTKVLKGAVPFDLNMDGRLDMAMWYVDQPPQFIVHSALNAYNQSTELALATEPDPDNPHDKPWEMACFADLKLAQEACAVADFTGDGAEDVAIVGKGGVAWLLKSSGTAQRGVSLAAPTATYGTTRVLAFEGTRCLGARLVQPYMSAFLAKPNPGPLKLEWTAAGATVGKTTPPVLKPVRVELNP